MNAKFLTTLDVRYHPQTKRWELLSPFIAVVSDNLYRVPPGYVTDFASVPRLHLAFMLFGNKGHRAAVIHDYLYSTHLVPREEADAIFKALLVEDGAGVITRSLMHLGVRIGGWVGWNNYREA